MNTNSATIPYGRLCEPYRLQDANDCPVADPEWSDLGEAYMQACRVLGREVRRG